MTRLFIASRSDAALADRILREQIEITRLSLERQREALAAVPSSETQFGRRKAANSRCSPDHGAPGAPSAGQLLPAHRGPGCANWRFTHAYLAGRRGRGNRGVDYDWRLVLIPTLPDLVRRLTRTHPDELTRSTWFQEEARAERFVALTRVVILSVWLVVTASVSGLVPWIANLSNVGVGAVWWVWCVVYAGFIARRPYRSPYKYVSTTVDMVLNTIILFLYHYGMGYSTTLKAPAFMTYLILGFMAAYRFSVVLPLYAGGLALAGFGGLVAYFVITDNIGFGPSLQSYTSPLVSPTVLVFQMAFIAASAVLGSLYANNIRKLVDRQVAYEIAIERERQLARTDDLTGVHNRRHFLALAEHEVATAKRYKRPLALLLFDIDHFKLVNDRWGHPFGDLILKEVAEAVKPLLRESDVLARYGGEEFAVLLSDSGAQQAAVAAERIRAAVAAHVTEQGSARATVTVSLGVAELAAPDDTLDALIDRADRALYAAKRAGRDRTVVA